MEASIHRFVRLLRIRAVRISVSEALDAMACAAQPGVLSDRSVLKEALRVALIKDRRDEATYDEVFDLFFSLVKVGESDTGHGHGHGHGDMTDDTPLEDFTLSEEPSETPQEGHDHGAPVDIKEFFDPEDLAEQYNLHQEANKIDMASMTDEIVLSKEQANEITEGQRVQIETDRFSGGGIPGEISQQQGTQVDADLSVAQQDALLGWLNSEEDALSEAEQGTEDDAAALRRRLAGVLENLPEMLKAHLEKLLEIEQRIVEGHDDSGRAAVGCVIESAG